MSSPKMNNVIIVGYNLCYFSIVLLCHVTRRIMGLCRHASCRVPCVRFIKMSSPNMNNVITVGCILCYFSRIMCPRHHVSCRVSCVRFIKMCRRCEQRHHSGLHPMLLESYYVSLPSCVMPCVMCQVHQDVQPQHEQRHHSGLHPVLLQYSAAGN